MNEEHFADDICKRCGSDEHQPLKYEERYNGDGERLCQALHIAGLYVKGLPITPSLCRSVIYEENEIYCTAHWG